MLAAASSILAAVTLFALTALVLVRHELRTSLDAALRQRGQDVAELAFSAPAVLEQPGALDSSVTGRQVFVQVIDARGRILARSLDLGARTLPQDALAREARVAGRPGFEDLEIDGRPYRLYAAPIADTGGAAAGGAMLVASDTGDIADTLQRLGLVVALAGAAITALAIAAAVLLTRRGLVPLRRLARAAGEIERTADPSRRLPETGGVDEIGQLTGMLNRMLASLEAARATERRFLADASHELRTPVTALLGNVEYVARHGADAEVLADLRHDAARLARLVDDLLVMERSGSAAEPPARVQLDLAELVRQRLAARPDLDGRVRTDALEPVHVAAEADALGRVLDNLIDNALVHGPAGGRVTVTLRRDGERALLSVSDEGPGPGPADRARIFERFWRAPGASGRAGSGLGLAIVRAIVERHGGTVDVDGSTFTVALPVRVPAAQG